MVSPDRAVRLAEATVTVRDVTHASSTYEITITNMLIKSVDSGANNRNVQGATYSFEATDIEVVASA